jgi:large subunit ribosomal protein L13
VDTLSYKTISVNKANAQKEWVLVDATDQVLGRLASKVAKLLRGKYKPSFTPNSDCGDNVVIINASKVKMTGNKWTDKEYFDFSGYPGGQKISSPEDIFKKDPTRLVRRAIKGMVPHTKLGAQQLRNLYIYVGSEHEQTAQNPKQIDINSLK